MKTNMKHVGERKTIKAFIVIYPNPGGSDLAYETFEGASIFTTRKNARKRTDKVEGDEIVPCVITYTK